MVDAMRNTHQTPPRVVDRRSSETPVQEDKDAGENVIKRLSSKWAHLTPEQRNQMRKFEFKPWSAKFKIAIGIIAFILGWLFAELVIK